MSWESWLFLFAGCSALGGVTNVIRFYFEIRKVKESVSPTSKAAEAMRSVRPSSLRWSLWLVLISLLLSGIGFYRSLLDGPHFHPAIDQIIAFTDEHDKRFKILLVASVRNSGSPSIADWGPLEAQLTNKQIVRGTAYQIPTELSMSISTKETRVFHGSDEIHRQTLKHPVGNGAHVRGLLLYVFEDASERDLSMLGTKFRLHVRDVAGNEYTAESEKGAQSAKQMNSFPDLNVETYIHK